MLCEINRVYGGLVIRPLLPISDSAFPTLFVLHFHTYPSLFLHFFFLELVAIFYSYPIKLCKNYIYMLQSSSP
jgi:hypothetical protein